MNGNLAPSGNVFARLGRRRSVAAEVGPRRYRLCREREALSWVSNTARRLERLRGAPASRGLQVSDDCDEGQV